MPKKPNTLASYLALAIEGYNEQLLQTGAGIGQAILFLSATDVPAENPQATADLERELRFAQDRIALIRQDLTKAAETFTETEH